MESDFILNKWHVFRHTHSQTLTHIVYRIVSPVYGLPVMLL